MKVNTNGSSTRDRVGKVKLTIIMALVVILPVGALMAAVLRSEYGASQVQQPTTISQAYPDLGEQLQQARQQLGELQRQQAQGQAIVQRNEDTEQLPREVEQALQQALLDYADSLLTMLEMLDNGQLTIDNEGNLVASNLLNRWQITQSGLRITKDEVYNIFGGTIAALVLIGTTAQAYLLATSFWWTVQGLVWAAIGWIPVVGQILAGALTGYIASQISLLAWALVNALAWGKGVELYMYIEWIWFVPVPTVGHRLI
ncbi:MAG: hypothetical protein LBK70_00090 [Clostridiales bacterium]|jgi:flagellar basal body-associated protein FliL|nr:hypothetical protein [Clostridiales bacterium]